MSVVELDGVPRSLYSSVHPDSLRRSLAQVSTDIVYSTSTPFCVIQIFGLIKSDDSDNEVNHHFIMI
jgi:hypothetical protein